MAKLDGEELEDMASERAALSVRAGFGRERDEGRAAAEPLPSQTGDAPGFDLSLNDRETKEDEEIASDEDGGREEVVDEAIARIISEKRPAETIARLFERRPAEGTELSTSWLCDMDHPLLPAVKDSTYVCDVCERDLAAGTTLVLCEECDYSLCAACFEWATTPRVPFRVPVSWS